MLLFDFSVQEVTPQNNYFLCSLLTVGRKTFSGQKGSVIGLFEDKHRNQLTGNYLQLLHIHQASSCSLRLHRTSHESIFIKIIFIKSNPKSIQPSILHQMATTCGYHGKTTRTTLEQLLYSNSSSQSPTICGLREELEEDVSARVCLISF